MARLDLPTGLRGAYLTLSNTGERSVLERLTSLVWVRLVTDRSMPKSGGFDSRQILDMPLSWDSAWDAKLLNALCSRVNELVGNDDLSTDWHELRPDVLEKAVEEVGRWVPDFAFENDPLGEISQRVRSDAAKGARGEFYTPYSVSLMMARMTAAPDGLAPGSTVLDPACGSGRMLLAAIEVCRAEHGVDQVPEVFGIDISPDACRLTRMNLVLAGIAPADRIQCADFLRMTPPEQLTPRLRSMQLALIEYEAGGAAVGWRDAV